MVSERYLRAYYYTFDPTGDDSNGGPDATALFTHHHYGWRKHDLPNSHPDHLTTALLDTHGFLRDYEGKYRIEIERTPACSYDGKVSVFWNHKDSKTDHVGAPLRQGDHWFFAFEFNVARNDACRHCGGTGIDHYVGPFFHCWACDGERFQVRASTPRGFKHKPTIHATLRALEAQGGAE